ncbi:hypothetical protein CAI21_13735 [Alkalilimnicola ehrlichii]|uniref:Carboxylic ester hydrolase n=1 Tax=Alkalilimnicola ehrlichii TaxID=351052 RepID=A0A3E0WNT7_9GAMM|nr:carboxylesterase family protein [Alkalilimnicola ehrlichii]RFA27975.1 hypothetical protein CAI21_13735 [Alkalilimnicola ehrlichii]RFA34622.1 hypothetical protein CAL65_14760 [Alkalilimnicola ehrlichii]
MKRLRAGVGTLALLMIAGATAGAQPTTPAAHDDPLLRLTEQGFVRGEIDARENMLAFRGIPYAAPPIGTHRFAPPTPPAAWDNVRAATAFGPDCAQPGGALGTASTEEDCLYLNVFAPTKGDNHPVMVWIHGGAFTSGSGTPYSPPRLVAEDMVVVTLNYRLGAFGFLAHPALSEEQNGRSGGYGLLDQKQALAWVQENIEAFGGDPTNVTLFGESAGGQSILALMSSPLTEGLFHKAIIMSGSVAPNQQSLADAERLGREAFKDCDIECLRTLATEDVLERQAGLIEGIGILINYGTKLQPERSIAAALKEGRFLPVPTLIGSNLDEFTLFVGVNALAGETPPPAAAYRDAIGNLIDRRSWGLAVRAIARAYPLAEYDDNVWQALSAIGTDAVFACNALMQTQQLAEHVPTYAYQFTDRDAPLAVLPERPAGLALGAAHAFELPYLFGQREAFRARGADDSQLALSERMIRYWTSFARNGDPNYEDGPVWPSFVDTERLLHLDPAIAIAIPSEDFFNNHHCRIWSR